MSVSTLKIVPATPCAIPTQIVLLLTLFVQFVAITNVYLLVIVQPTVILKILIFIATARVVRWNSTAPNVTEHLCPVGYLVMRNVIMMTNARQSVLFAVKVLTGVKKNILIVLSTVVLLAILRNARV